MTKRTIFFVVALYFIFASAIVFAQTPEALIEQVPDLPTVEVLSASKAQPAPAASGRGLGGKLSALQAAATGGGGSETDNFKKQIERLRMTVAQHEMVAAMTLGAAAGMPGTDAMPAGMGGMTMAEIQAMQKMSPKEQEEFMLKKHAEAMGLTVEEVKAMQGMTPAQQEAYMKQGDRMQRMANAQMAQSQAAAGTSYGQAIENIIEMTANDGYDALERAMELAIEQEREAVTKRIKTAQQKHGGNTAEFYTEAYTLWREQIGKEQTRIKALLPEAKKASDMEAWRLVNIYLSATEAVLELPEV